MSSFEERYCLSNPTWGQRLRRDIALLVDSLSFFGVWLTRGRRLRRAYQQAQKDQTQIILEDMQGEEQ